MKQCQNRRSKDIHTLGQIGFFTDLKKHIEVRTKQDPDYIRKFIQMVTGSFYLGISDKISVEFDHGFW